MTIVDSLKQLRNDLLQCKCVCDVDEHQVIDDMLATVTDLLTAKRREAGYQAVYDRAEKLYEGTPEICALYVDILKEAYPEIELTIQPL